MKKLSNQLTILFFFFAIIPIILILQISSSIILNSKNDKLIDEVEFNLNQVSKNIEWHAQKLNNHIKDIQNDSRIQKVLNSVVLKGDNKGYINNVYEMKDILSSYLLGYEDYVFSIILGEDEGYYIHGDYMPGVEKLRESDLYEQIIDNECNVVYKEAFKIGEGTNFYENSFFLAGAAVKNMTYASQTKYLGTYLVFMDNDYFSKIVANTNRNTNMRYIVIDNNGGIVMDEGDYDISEKTRLQIYDQIKKNNEGNGEIKTNENHLWYFYNNSELTGWKVINILPNEYFQSEKRGIVVMISIIILCCLLFVLGLSLMLSKYVSKPIVKLSLAMKHVKEKDFNISVPVHSSNEIGEITEGFNQMIGEVRRLFDNVVSEEEMKRKAQLEALHYQINPHFLYNTITSIGLYASLQGSEKIPEMTNVLGRLLKNKLSKPDMLSLGEELDNIKDYIFILQIRYERKIKIYYDIDEDLLNIKIGSFFLQPIVENSIYHGLNSKLNLEEEEAILKISAVTEGDKVIVEIYDNGQGLTQETIDSILEVNKDSNVKDPANGIGIQNINHRIKFMYGEKYGINIDSKVGYYTKVKLILPVEKKKC